VAVESLFIGIEYLVVFWLLGNCNADLISSACY